METLFAARCRASRSDCLRLHDIVRLGYLSQWVDLLVLHVFLRKFRQIRPKALPEHGHGVCRHLGGIMAVLVVIAGIVSYVTGTLFRAVETVKGPACAWYYYWHRDEKACLHTNVTSASFPATSVRSFPSTSGRSFPRTTTHVANSPPLKSDGTVFG